LLLEETTAHLFDALFGILAVNALFRALLALSKIGFGVMEKMLVKLKQSP
jgi:hypothetical protein